MEYLKDIVSTLLVNLSGRQSYEDRLKEQKKTLGLPRPVIRFLVAMFSQAPWGSRSYYKRIQRGSVKGVWFGQGANYKSEQDFASGSGPVVFFVHGGAFLCGQTKMWARYAINLVDEHKKKYGKDMRIFFIDYTLAPDKQFPHQLNECRVGVDYLLRTLKINPARVFLAGDSAGGNMCLGTLFEMENAKSLAGAIVYSPWVMVGSTLCAQKLAQDVDDVAPKQGSSWFVNDDTDYLDDKFGAQGITAYIGNSMSMQDAYHSPRISPGLRSKEEMAKLPKMLVSWGNGERLRDQVVAFVEDLKTVADVETLVGPGVSPHDWALNKGLSKDPAEYFKGLETVSAFIEKGMIHA